MYLPTLNLLAILIHFALISRSATAALSNTTLPTAVLPYGTFIGAYSATYDLTHFRKIPFAAPPIGQNRFRAPQPPLEVKNGSFDSNQAFDMCPQRTVNGSEDCLYLGLYSRPWTKGRPLRPVVVVFYGGGFIQGTASFGIPPSAYPVLNVWATNDLLFVYPNYRVNAFGFLPGKQIADDPLSDLNVGLLDQQAALLWTHQYIEKFGGNPNDVTIWGQSAGGASVVAQVVANGGETKPKLFSKALSSSPFWAKTYDYDAPEAQARYDDLVAQTGCADAVDSLKCLKSVDVQTIRTASLNISNSHIYTTSSFTWGPVIDGTFLKQRLSLATLKKGTVNIDYGWGMYNSLEGLNFLPPGLGQVSGSNNFNNSESGFDFWLRGFLPGFSEQQIRGVKDIYPTNGTTETMTYTGNQMRAGLVLRDVTLACPATWMAGAAGKKSYVGEYTIAPARHASDVVWWNSVSNYTNHPNLIYNGYAGAFASFFETGDPNKRKLTDATQAAVPELKETGMEFTIAADGFRTVKLELLGKRCEFWRGVAKDVPV